MIPLKEFPGGGNSSTPGVLPSGCDSLSLGGRDLLRRLLEPDQSRRLRSLMRLQEIPFFHGFSFADVRSKKMTNSSGNNDQIILATGGYDHTIKLWQLNTGVCQRTAQHSDSQVNALAITPDKQLLAAAGHQHIRMYDLLVGNPSPVINYEGVNKNVTGVGFHEDGKWMFTGGEDCRARIWDLRSKNLQCQRIFQVTAPVNCVCLHPNQSELVVGDQSGVIHLWDLRTDHNEQLIPEADASVQSIAIDRQGKMMAAVNNRGHGYVWSLTSDNDQPTLLKPRHKIHAHRRYALACRISPDSKYLVTTSADQSARVWETEQFSLVLELKHDSQRWVWDAVFSADSKYLITASSDGVARLWNLENGNIEREYSGHQKAVTALAYCDQLPVIDNYGS